MGDNSTSKALVKRALFNSVARSSNKELDERELIIVATLKAQYADIFRVVAKKTGGLFKGYASKLELLPEFDEMSGDLICLKGWTEQVPQDSTHRVDSSYGEIELKSIRSRNGVIYGFKGTIEWLACNVESMFSGKTTPVSTRVKYKLSSGRICGFVPSFIGDSRILKKASVEYRSEEFKVKLTA